MTCSPDVDTRRPVASKDAWLCNLFARTCLRLCSLLLAVIAAWPGPARAADPRISFARYDLPWDFRDRDYADVNGDGLLDLLAIADDGLHIFLQDRHKGFTPQRQVSYPTDKKAAVLWPAKIGPGPADQVLMLTPRGLSALRFDDAAGHETPLIECPTIIPPATESRVFFFPLCLKTGGDWPLLLVPAEAGLQVWRHEGQAWGPAGTIAEGLQSSVRGPFGDVAYRLYRFTNLAVGDINGDGRDDLVVRQVMPDRDQLRLRVHLQDADGRLPVEPSRQFDLACTALDWVCLQDMNHDGRVDLVKNTWVRYPLIMPGTWSGKIIVRVYLADPRGDWPAGPTYLFRKHDWQGPVPIVDIDGDGRIDLALGFYLWKGREEMTDAIESGRLVFDLRVYMAAADGSYPSEPAFIQKVAVRTRGIGLNINWDIFGEAYSLEGDFNGDGRKDLLVRSDKDEVSAFLFESPQAGFARKAGVVFRLGSEEGTDMAVRDLNGDGISDLMVYLHDKKQLAVFLSRGK